MATIASVPEPRVLEILVKARPVQVMPSPALQFIKTTGFQSPALQLFKNVHTQSAGLQVIKSTGWRSPAVQLFKATGWQSPALQLLRNMKPMLDPYAQTELKRTLIGFQGLAGSSGFTALSQQYQDALAEIAMSLRPFAILAPLHPYEAEIEIPDPLPVTPVQVQVLEHAVDEAIADPQHRALVERVASSLGLTPRTLAWLVAMTCVLLPAASVPLMVDLSPAWGLAFSNEIAVAAIVISTALALKKQG